MIATLGLAVADNGIAPGGAAHVAEVCNPVLVEIWRGSLVESRHRGAAAVVRADGTVIASWGSIDRPILPRSAIKPFQALPLIESGAADRFELTEVDLALVCASHSGEPVHVEGVADLLRRLGLSGADLICGGHLPYHDASARAMIRAGHRAGPIHNNCSGKHAGFLATALHLREPTTGYAGPVHPVQLRVRRVLGQMANGTATIADDSVIDGCGAPNFPLPLRGLALAMARLVDPRDAGRLRTEAARRLVAAMIGYPHLVAGSGRFDTVVMSAAAGAVVSKAGAEAVQVAALPGTGIGLAVKIDDGGKRAAECAMATLLAHYAQPDANTREALAPWVESAIANVAGQRVGAIRPAADWTGSLSA